MERYRLCTCADSSCLAMVCQRSTSFSSCDKDAPWQIIDKKKKKEVGTETVVEVKSTNIQPGFVAAKGSVPVKSGKKRKLEDTEI